MTGRVHGTTSRETLACVVPVAKLRQKEAEKIEGGQRQVSGVEMRQIAGTKHTKLYQTEKEKK